MSCPPPPQPLKYELQLETFRVHTGVGPSRGNGPCTECDKYCENIYSHLNLHVRVNTTKENLERNMVCELCITLVS